MTTLRKPSEHGLGLYRRQVPDPAAWCGQWPWWIELVWQRFIDELEGRSPGPEPDWFDTPAVGEVSTTSPALMAPFRALNEGRAYAEQVKPFNFMLLGHVDPLAPLPEGAERGRLALVAPFSSHPSAYLGLPWRNRFDGKPYLVTTRRGGEPGKVRLKTYRDVVRDYRLHPELKSGDPRGGPCVRSTVGYLPRRPVIGIGVRHIGKESNRMHEIEEGLVTDFTEAYVEYRDEAGEWRETVVPRLQGIRAEKGVALPGGGKWAVRAGSAGRAERRGGAASLCLSPHG